jgi:hypothetical protein
MSVGPTEDNEGALYCPKFLRSRSKGENAAT